MLYGPAAQNVSATPELVLEDPVEDPEEETSADAESEYETAMWRFRGREEVLAEAEAPQTISEAASTPEIHYEATRAFIWPVIGEIEVPYSVESACI
jgi:hypothetical protein